MLDRGFRRACEALKNYLSFPVLIKCNSLAASMFFFFFFLSSSTKTLPTICFYHWGFAAVLRSCRQTLVFHVSLSSSLHGGKAELSVRIPSLEKGCACKRGRGNSRHGAQGQQIQLWCLHLSCEHCQQQVQGESWVLTECRERALPCPGQLRSWANLLPYKSHRDRTNVLHLTHKQENQEFISPPFLATSVLINFHGRYRLGFNLY